MRVLFLSRWFPYPADNGSRIRVYNLLKVLGSRWQVDLVSFADDVVTESQYSELRRFCRLVEVVPYRAYRSTSWRAQLGFLSARPRSVVDTDNPAMRQRLAEVMSRSAYDVLIASELEMIMYGAELAAPIRIAEEVQVAVFHDAYMKATSLSARLRRGLTWWKTSRYVRWLLSRYHGATVASPAEEALLRRVASPQVPPIAVVPNGVEISACNQEFGPLEPDSLIYAGALTYDANYDAVAYFLSEVFPRILAARPKTRLYVTGKVDGVPLENLPQQPNVVYTGYLTDVRPRVAQSWVSVVPLRVGGGTRLKILESLALGTPVVATSKGAQGLGLQAGQEVLLANEPQDFAAEVLRVLQSPQVRAELSASGRAAATRFDWVQIGRGLMDFIVATGQTPVSALQPSHP